MAGLVSVDVICVYAALVVGYTIRDSSAKPLEHYISLPGFCATAAALVPVLVLILAGCGLYSDDMARRRGSQFGRISAAVGIGVMLLIVVDYLTPRTQLFPSRAVPLYGLVLGILFVLVGRWAVAMAMRPVYARGHSLHNIVIIGADSMAEMVSGALSRKPGNRVVAAVSPSADGCLLNGTVPVYANVEQALTSQQIRIDEILQTDVSLTRTEIVDLIAVANARGMTYRFVPDLFGVYAAASTMSTVAGIPVMEVRLTSLDGWARVSKRVFDLVGAAAALLLLTPLMTVVALLVKLHDPQGPVFYRQTRLGRGGLQIDIFKFRSMLWQYSTGPDRPFKTAVEAFQAMGRPDLCAEFVLQQKVANDPRVSKLGVFLRRTSLDELPQLFNVLLGHLSLVGPRPIVLDELERYGEQRTSFLALKPGITGLWQVSGRSDVGYDERVKLDMAYVENWSHLLDLAILARTVVVVAARRGAY